MSTPRTIASNLIKPVTGRGGRIGRARASRTEGREFETRPSQSNDFKIYTSRYLDSRSALLG